ncbi:MAG: Cys-tRNA(Pro) deacylase [Oscillibacter sp.]|nr:Cys-tRNA(Pro) deacylase [Oscillibacter sp.]
MKKKEEKTNVMRILERAGIPYTAHFYRDTQGPEGTSEYGLHIARTLGQDPARVFKTLVARGASKNCVVFEVPAEENLDLKKAARAAGEKSVELLHVADINAVTGYIRGGCSPVGMKKQFLTVFHRTALDFPTIFISAGKIGAQAELAAEPLIALLGGKAADIIV